MKGIRIKQINYGIAYQVTDGKNKYIEVNKHLKKYPYLYKKVLAHEEEHLEATGIWENFMIDFKDQFDLKKQVMMMGFVVRHPSGWGNLFPVFFENKRVSVNWFTSTFWLASITLFIIIMIRMYRMYQLWS